MNELVNLSPLVVETIIAVNNQGEETLAVVAKATYEFTNEGLRLADKQLPLQLVDVYPGPPESSELTVASDRVLHKPATDVLLKGHAQIPHRRSTEVDVVLRVGPVEKVVRVFGNRVWHSSVGRARPTAPAPFERMPLTWSRAYGGIDSTTHEALRSNPVGVGFRGKKSPAPLNGAPLPNLESPSTLMRDPEDRCVPAAFGPLAPHWEGRQRLAGTYDDAWRSSRAPFLPDDYDPRFQQVAPPDQVVPGYLKGGEAAEILNASALGRLSFRVPQVVLEAHLRTLDGDEPIATQLDTVVIDGDEGRVLLTWRGSQSVHGRVYSVESIHVSAQGDL